MRKPPLGPTAPQRVVPCALLVGVDSKLATLCRQSTAIAAGARLELCDMASVTSRAAELRPFAVIIPRELLDFDPSELIALARSVRASLIPLETDRVSTQLGRAELVRALRDAYQQWQR
ncbi:MAG: hypothetical protein IT377_27895 [Polyangiaceae bacterium]|nr:hypothetical protein [Myxococcales bacterium]MCC6902826.1 hypothetical protein [Polyangiaceae bacterium]